MEKITGSVDLLSRWSGWDKVLSLLSSVAIGSYLLLYVLVPGAYEVGPAFLFVLALVFFRWWWGSRIDKQSLGLIAVLLLVFLGQALALLIHGEDITEFDLSSRYLAAAIVLPFLMKYPISVSNFFLATALGAIATGVHAFYQFEVDGIRRVLAFDNPVHYGNGALALAVISLGGMVWAARQRFRTVWFGLFIAAAVGGIYASLVSGTRSGWVALPVIVLIGLYTYWSQIKRHRWLALSLLIGLVLSSLLVSQVGFVKQRTQVAVGELVAYYTEDRNDTSVGLRLDMWKAGLVAFSHNPVIGSGPSGMDSVLRQLVVSNEIHPAVESFRHLHNQYIDVMARYGLIGLVSYIALLVVSFCLFLKKSRSKLASVSALGLSGAGFVALHSVVNLTQSILERNIGVMMFISMIVFIWATLKDEENTHCSARPTAAN